MLVKNDLFLLLTELEEDGENVTKQFSILAREPGISGDVLKFINDRRQFDVAAFYELMRKNYNNKKSPLYKNLVREEHTDSSEILTTLSALNLQIVLYAKHLEDDKMFLSHSRASDITMVLNNYYDTYDLIPCIKLLQLIKADLKAFEQIR